MFTWLFGKHDQDCYGIFWLYFLRHRKLHWSNLQDFNMVQGFTWLRNQFFFHILRFYFCLSNGWRSWIHGFFRRQPKEFQVYQILIIWFCWWTYLWWRVKWKDTRWIWVRPWLILFTCFEDLVNKVKILLYWFNIKLGF